MKYDCGSMVVTTRLSTSGRFLLLWRQDIEDKVDSAVHFVEAAAEALPGVFLSARRLEFARKQRGVELVEAGLEAPYPRGAQRKIDASSAGRPRIALSNGNHKHRVWATASSG